MPVVREHPAPIDPLPEDALGVQPPANRFRLNCTHVFLTYAQCLIPDHETLLTLITALFTNRPWSIQHHTIGRERHQDGNTHYHVCLTFTRKVDIRDARFFDLTYDGTTYHPNIKPVKRGKDNLQRVLDYCQKDGDSVSTHPAVTPKLTWGELLDQSTSRDHFLTLVRENHPREYITMLERILFFADYHYPPPPPEPYVHNPDLQFPNLPQGITNWVQNEFTVRFGLFVSVRELRPRTSVVTGSAPLRPLELRGPLRAALTTKLKTYILTSLLTNYLS